MNTTKLPAFRVGRPVKILKQAPKHHFLPPALVAGLNLMLATTPGLHAQTFTNLFTFSGNDGANPYAGLVLSGHTLYGTTHAGGSSGYGAVFKINTDGTGFASLHGFTAISGANLTNGDGASPWAAVISSGNLLYGTAPRGGSSGYGTVFSINTDGTSFTTLHSFAGSDGASPEAELALSGNTLYGTTSIRGSSGLGTVFAVNTDGTGFTTLHSFAGSDGAYPFTGLTSSGNTLYGTTPFKGGSGFGTVFAVNTNGSGFNVLHNFTGASEGASPQSGLILSDNTLYGSAFSGGSAGSGTLFRINIDGSGLTILHDFTAIDPQAGFNPDGAGPGGGLILSGNTLYGRSTQGGRWSNGTVFAVNIDGTGFTNLHDLADTGGGAASQAGLILYANTLYGTGTFGGANGDGTVFRLSLPLVSWPEPADISYGTPLSSSQLSATAIIPGTFEYSPGLGAVLGAGNGQLLSVTFTPTDAVSYPRATNTVTINVRQSPLTITCNDRIKTYGQAMIFTGIEFAASGLLNGDTVASVALASSGAAATATVADSPYAINPGAALGTGLGNYAISYASGALIISPARLMVTASNASRAFAGADPLFSGTIGGAQNGDVIGATYAVGATPASPVGAYPIVPALVDPDNKLGNYSVTLVNGILTITPATPQITWTSPASIVYGTPLSGLQLNAAASVSGAFAYQPALGAALGAGSGQTLSATFTPADAIDYTTATASVTLDVEKAALTITANDKTMTNGAPLPVLTTRYQGFVYGDDAGALTTLPVLTTTATVSNPPGTYPIEVSGATSLNYNITFMAGTLTIVPDALVPAISITDPTNDATFAAVTNITITADAIEVGGTIDHVTFFADGTPIGTASTPPYAMIWSNATTGQHVLTVIATDAFGTSGTSAPVAIGVTARDMGWTSSIVVHLINDSGQDIYNTLGTNSVFVTDFKGTNDVTITDLAGSLSSDYLDTFGGMFSANNPSYLTNFIGSTTNGTGDGVPGDLEDITIGAGLSVQFDFAQRLTTDDRFLLVDCDNIEQYEVQAFIKNGSGYTAVSLTNWGVENFPGSTGELPNSSFPVWNLTTNGGMLLGQGTFLSQPLTVFTPDQAVDRVTVTETVGYGSADLQFVHPVFGNMPPVITQQPASITTNQGAGIQFTVATTGTSPLAYQWQFNGTNLPGATNVTLTFGDVQTSNAGPYSVVISNVAGMTTSSNAYLMVNVSCDPAPSGLIAWWPGNGNATDIIGGNNGTMESGADFVAGLVGQCFAFDGSDQGYMLVPDETHGLPEGTIEFWFKANVWDYSAPNDIIMLWTATLNAPPNGQYDGMDLGTDFQNTTPGELMFGIWTVDGYGWHWAHSGIVPQPGNWYHMAATWGPGGISLFVNGALAGSDPYAGSAPPYTIHNVVGHSSWSGSGFNGLIDEISIYNRALAANEIAGIYNGGSAGKCRMNPVIAWANPAPVTYGTPLGSNQLDATASVSGAFAYNPTNGTVLNAGTNTLSVIFTPANLVDYNLVTNRVNLTVLPAPLTITAGNASRSYGAVDPVFTGNINGLMNEDIITASNTTPATQTSPVGSYPIIPVLADPGHRLANYAVITNDGTLTITQAVPVITWAKPADITYGTPLNGGQLDATASVPGALVYNPPLGTVLKAGNGQMLSVMFTPNDTTNYTTAFASVAINVRQAPLAVTANPQTKTYGQTLNLGTTAYTTSGLVNGDTVTNVTLASPGAAAKATVAGSPYAITPSAAAGMGMANYTISYVNGLLTVNPALLTIIASPQSKTYGMVLNLGSTAFTTSGLFNGDTVTSVTLISPGAAATAAVAGSPYAITPSAAVGTGLGNYTISYQPGFLTIDVVPPLAALSISDAMVTAPASGSTNAVFTVTLSAPGNQAVRVSFATADGTAQAGVDYMATNGTLTFPAGVTNQTILVSVLGRAANPGDESFFVNLSGASGATALTNQGVGLIHRTAPFMPVITLVSPANQSAFCYGSTIPLLAVVSNNVSAMASVAFYAGSTWLGSNTSAPYTFEWDGAMPGDYSLSATASFADGSTLSSSPALVSVNTLCGDVAIVRNFPDPEIDQLQTNLFQMGLSSVVFDQAGLSAAELQGYELVIWDGLGGATNRITDNTVSVLQSVFTNGIPLYLIGDNLASDSFSLDEPQRSQWIQLTGLNPATGKGGDGSVEVSSVLTRDPLLNGRYGDVMNFSYATNLDLTTLANTNSGVLGYSGTNVVLVTNPATDAGDTGQTRIVTQDFRLQGGAAPDSLAQRQTLFLDSVCWLVRCPPCSVVGLGLVPTAPDSGTVGQPLTYAWSILNNGECDGIGAILTCPVPPGAQFVGAQSEIGTWAYETNLAVVVFQLGLLPHGSAPTVSITLLPLQAGMLTNSVDVRITGLATNDSQVVTQVVAPAMLNLLWSGGTNYLLQLSAPAGHNYEIQISPDLLHWTDWTNVTGPLWMTPLLDPFQTNFNWRFYRAQKTAQP